MLIANAPYNIDIQKNPVIFFTNYIFMRILAIFFIIISLSSCTKTEIKSGYAEKMEDITSIKTGMTEQQVIDNLGYPSLTNDFGNKTWYYISRNSEKIAFLRPKIISQHIIAVEFKDGIATNINKYDEKDSKNIMISNVKTKDLDKEPGAAKQLFGNIGRFNNPSGIGSNPGTVRNRDILQ